LGRPGIGRQRTAFLAALGLPGLGVLAVFLLLPLAVVCAEAFAQGGAAFTRLVQRPDFASGLLNTLSLGIIAGVLSVSLGALVAYHLAQLPERRRAGLLLIIALPLTFSGLVVAFGFIITFGRAGFVTQSLAALTGVDAAGIARFVYSAQGLAFVYSYYLIPRVVMLMVPVFVNFDRRQLAAAESCGASRPRALAGILLPQVLPQLIAAFCLVAAVAFGAYGTALALAGSQVNILPLQLFTMISETGTDFPAAAALSLVLVLICSLTMALGDLVQLRRAD
jgi:putative spermidine/putrescine transport system permease protein